MAHVRVHIGDEDVLQAVVVDVEDLDPIDPQEVRGNSSRPRLTNRPAMIVLEILVVALHVEYYKSGQPSSLPSTVVASPDQKEPVKPIGPVTSAKRLFPSLWKRRLRSARSGIRCPWNASSNAK